MTGDTFDRFNRRERGRFGDNEQIRGNDSVRSRLLDVQVTFLEDRERAIAVAILGGGVGPVIWLPKSQIGYAPLAPTNGQTIEVTLPRWLAEREGLT